ncbi:MULTISPECIES: ParA family protein [Acetobacter]|nr:MULTISPECIES: ParA family protein [Acetobacter]MCG4258658.1 ParA family protein [Acetobacter senegalensis]MCG4260901.1 ParA family protein [Acetobacter senegalensis]MCG4268533.1 ParA family protein [Acetobacter senegalensis]
MLGKTILFASVKGGTSKSTLSECISVCAARDGMRVSGIDFDPQATFRNWGDAREETQKSIPSLTRIPVKSLTLSKWKTVEDYTDDNDLVVIDTPPALENDADAFLGLSQLADVVLVPTSATHNDISSNTPYLLSLKKAGVRAFVVFSRVNRQTKSFREARQRVAKYARVLPVEIPIAEDMHVHNHGGLTSVDIKDARGSKDVELLWDLIKHEIEL